MGESGAGLAAPDRMPNEVHENCSNSAGCRTLPQGLVHSRALTMAAEIKVLSAGAVEPGLKRGRGSSIQKRSGNEVKITFNTAPEIRKRVADGEVLDVVIAPPAALDEFAKAGKVAADRATPRPGRLGVAVRPGAELPDISSTEALKRIRARRGFDRASTAPRPGSIWRTC